MSRNTNQVLVLTSGVAVGALLAYLFDPDRGARRRGLVRDKAVSAANQTNKFMGKAGRDLQNRAQGLAHELKNPFGKEDTRGREGGQNTQFEFLQANWSPGARLIAGAAGGALTIYGASKRDALGAGVCALGVGLLARSVTNTELKRLVGAGGE